MKLRSICSLVLAVLFCAGACAQVASTPQVNAEDVPRFPAIDATNAVRTFQTRAGFLMQLVASEPLVVDPVAMSFDEDGRLFVACMRDYPDGGTNAPLLGQVRMLMDTNSDGVFDKGTIYARDLPLLSGVICYDGGIFVAATPNILYLKDKDGDGVADSREVIFTGFGEGVPRLNIQSLVNSLTWGLDNRIHGVTSGNGGNIVSPKAGWLEPIPLRGKDFSFDPKTFDFGVESGTAQFGMGFNSRGRKFLCDNSHHAKLVMYEARYAMRNPYYVMPPAVIDIAPPAAPIYRISPDEPWRVIRTRWRTTGVLPSGGIQDGGGRVSGYFSAASGITIYRGTAFPNTYAESLLVCDSGGNLIHHDTLRQSGVALVAERTGDPRTEFVASRDTWFRPVTLANAPDGTIYVADMYREIIEHPWALPDAIKQHLDLNRGNDRGRIYRIIPSRFVQPQLLTLSKASTALLVSLLDSPNGWHRDTAARLIYERQDKTAANLISRLFVETRSPLARVHALHALDGLKALTQQHIERGLADRDERVREHAVLLSERLVTANGPMNNSLWNRLAALRYDSSPLVRYQLAFTAGETRHPQKVRVLSDILRRDIEDRWVRAAVFSSLSNGAGEMLEMALKDSQFTTRPAGKAFLNELATMIGAQNSPAEVQQAMNALVGLGNLELSLHLFSGLGDGLRRAKSSLDFYDPQQNLALLYENALAMIDYYRGTNSVRMGAIRLLSHTSYERMATVYFNLLALDESPEVKIAALQALSKFPQPEVSAGIVQRWRFLSPRTRTEALRLLMSRRDGMAALLAGVRSGVIPPSELNTEQIRTLTNHRDQRISGEATQIFGQRVIPEREQALARYRDALGIRPIANNGRAVYRANCASCHQLGGEGTDLGPSLASARAHGKEKLLVHILDPDREVAPNYISYTIHTKDGESVTGLIANETGTSLVVRQPNGIEQIIFNKDIDRIQTAGLSLMPAGLEVGMTLQEMADLLEYVMTAPAPSQTPSSYR